MTVRFALALAAAGAVLVLSACHDKSTSEAAAPTPTASVAPTPAATPVASSGMPVDPTLLPCGADKLSTYLNLLPTSTARDEIIRSLGHDRIRYVGPDNPMTVESRERVTAQLGADGRIKRFRCG